MNIRNLGLCLGLLLASLAQAVELQKGDRICLVGNELGERLQHHNYWESLLHQRFPAHNLTVRNLCFPGDEPFERLRSLNFGSPDDHLKHSKADVILFFFGFNESFNGHKGAASFQEDIVKLVKETQGKNYSGKGAPRIALVSPIAFENTGDSNLPDGKQHNMRLKAYSEALAAAAEETGVQFVDLFQPTLKLFEESKQRLTLNGSHLNDKGYQALAPIFDKRLFGVKGAPVKKADALLHAEIDDKNFHWWHRYRAVNGYSIYGKRGRAGSDGTYNNTDVMERERTILDQMCAIRDARIWKLAQGQKVAAKPDDSTTLPFIQPKTNVGGANDPNRKRGKLGSLDYLSGKEQQKLFKLAPGYEINLVASEEDFPELANPVSMNFDNRGRLWVTVMPSYPQWQPKRKQEDKILILEDLDQDGRADKCKIFADELHVPTGFELGRNGVFVAQQPDILFLQDTDGDDKADVRIRKLAGFDSADSHHGLAAFEWGPGGALYCGEGTFKQSQVESPYGLTRMGDAGVWRYEPTTAKFSKHISLAFANPWGHVFDRWGQDFIADASPGFNYWGAPVMGKVDHPDKHPGGCRDKGLDFGGPKSKKRGVPYPTFIKKRTRPSSGCEIVSSRHFPPEAQGDFLQNNVIGDRMVLQHTVSEKDSGFVGKEVTPLVSCDDGNFRPVDLQFGPDGALYIVDWHNALIGHLQHNLREPNRDHAHGRIWRVTYPSRPLVKPAKIAGESLEHLLNLLHEPEDRTRYRVRRELAQRDPAKVIAATKKWIEGVEPNEEKTTHQLLEALWIHQTHNVVNQDLLEIVLECGDHRARAAATRVARYWREQLKNPLALLKKSIGDSHPRVRLEAIVAASYYPPEEVQEAILDVLEQDTDQYIEYALDETLRYLDTQ